MSKSIALFGGSFDPVHIGHLQSAQELADQLAFDEFYLVPCHMPPHRTVQGEALHRREMLALALADFPSLCLDESELNKATSSYTIETLQYWRNKLGERVSITWVMGSDAFAKINTWHQWRQLTDYANILVMHRAEQAMLSISPEIQSWIKGKEVQSEMLLEKTKGSISFIELNPWPVSASLVREIIKSESGELQNSTVKKLLPESVWQYIEQHHLYR